MSPSAARQKQVAWSACARGRQLVAGWIVAEEGAEHFDEFVGAEIFGLEGPGYHGNVAITAEINRRN